MTEQLLQKANDLKEQIESYEYRIEAINDLLSNEDKGFIITIGLDGDDLNKLHFYDQALIRDILLNDMLKHQRELVELNKQFNLI